MVREPRNAQKIVATNVLACISVLINAGNSWQKLWELLESRCRVLGTKLFGIIFR